MYINSLVDKSVEIIDIFFIFKGMIDIWVNERRLLMLTVSFVFRVLPA